MVPVLVPPSPDEMSSARRRCCLVLWLLMSLARHRLPILAQAHALAFSLFGFNPLPLIQLNCFSFYLSIFSFFFFLLLCLSFRTIFHQTSNVTHFFTFSLLSLSSTYRPTPRLLSPDSYAASSVTAISICLGKKKKEGRKETIDVSLISSSEFRLRHCAWLRYAPRAVCRFSRYRHISPDKSRLC